MLSDEFETLAALMRCAQARMIVARGYVLDEQERLRLVPASDLRLE